MDEGLWEVDEGLCLAQEDVWNGNSLTLVGKLFEKDFIARRTLFQVPFPLLSGRSSRQVGRRRARGRQERRRAGE